MNQGLYGFGSGSGGASRRVVYKSPNGLHSTSPCSGAALATGVSLLSATPSAGVRTRLLSLQGSGAIRFSAIQAQAATASTMTLELVIDGVVVCTATGALSATSHGLVVAGGAASGGIVVFCFDYVPFSSSAEVYVTQSVSVAISHANIYELNQ